MTVGGVKICIAIAVSTPEDPHANLKQLPGALNAADSIIEWASALGYRTVRITDSGDKAVTCSRLQDEVIPLISDRNVALERIIVSFAGHGMISGTRDFWLLSNWFSGAEEIVDVELMRGRLATYRPAQMTIISDACRTTLPNEDPTLQGSRVFKRSGWQPTEPDCDVLLATGIGEPSFMVPSRETAGAYCLFTYVVTNALWGRYEGSIDYERPSGPAVTSQTLKTVVRRQLPIQANLLNQSQSASLVTNFTPPDDVYTLVGQIEVPPVVTLQSATQYLKPRGPGGRQAGADPPAFNTMEDAGLREILAKTIEADLVSEAHLRPTDFVTGTGFALVGGTFAEVAAAPGTYSRLDVDPSSPEDSRGRWWLLNGEPSSLAARVAETGNWVCASLYPKMIGTVTLDQRDGAMSLVYRSTNGTPPGAARATEQAIAAMHAGTIVGDEALDLAVRIREWKHNDPVLGVIAAYLYARVGDFENIRKIAWFYCDEDQPIPFDVALLAGLSLRRTGPLLHAEVPATRSRPAKTASESLRTFVTEATPDARGPVAGGFPWFRQGWSVLQDSDQTPLEPIKSLSQHLLPAMFTTLPQAPGAHLADLIRKGLA